MSTTKKTSESIANLTEAQRKALAAKIIKARESGQPWDGENGIVNDERFPLVRNAIVGRKLVREAGKDSMIRKSYDRAEKGLVGPRVAKSQPKTSTKKTQPAAKKTAAKKTQPRRTRAAK